MAQGVLCEVNECMYWKSGNKCSAESIYVVSPESSHHFSETEEPGCKTFEPAR
ncbi:MULTISPECIES: DUF1540 domain-containing protein [Priestia]|uniref:DUF1540 domain-containing protein n=1 Tax=Priestia megaterium TaxID=1404 RepID=A0ABD4WPB4_PRIMG|nr:DUF1540 domain-containing protein [Priestia megaterium]MCF6797845.1 DUF1540 domain-containing protein [Bacillus sp. ET1]MBD8843416.1 DUF1540 domain-containing protein [Priestia megaterium]MDD9782068.1 DUF1540 domain-containing protein [Priestia megaterium]MDN4864022.1 DUF1540 domain-containing protein [Priestia megaterium]MED3815474.1 DUF1540 domain-containing protein [Priestia megaterium]